MRNLYIYTLFNKQGEPLLTGIQDSGTGKRTYLNLYCKGCKTTIYDIEENKKILRKIFISAIANRLPIITSEFKLSLAAFSIPLEKTDYQVYDVCLGSKTDMILPTKSIAKSVVDVMLDKMKTINPMPWQKIFANAAVVYQSMEDCGVLIGLIHHRPSWSQETYSGRSKNIGTNIQGADGTELTMNTYGSESDRFIHFDWVAADLRIASLLSGDSLLQSAFDRSDPYGVLMEVLISAGVEISRSDCKLMLLKAINSFDFGHMIMTEIFTDLGRWLKHSNNELDDNGCLESILNRRFSLAKAKNQNKLAVLNAVLQGSVAHAIQLVIKRVWDIVGNQLMADIHDSIVVTCRNETECIQQVIKNVSRVMAYPFVGLLESNPCFPVRISIGKKFRKWREISTCRNRDGILIYEKQITKIDSEEKTTGEAEA